jgi:hypothetical protein
MALLEGRLRDLVTPANRRALEALGHTRFPHLSQADAAVWATYLASNAWRYAALDYDVSVGGLAAEAASYGSGLLPMWRQLLRKRIDVVGWTAEAVEVIEVKPLSSMGALGQVLSYVRLLREEREFTLPLAPVVVSRFSDPDLVSVYASFGVELRLVLAG